MRAFFARPSYWLAAGHWQVIAVTGLLGLLAVSMLWALSWSPGAPHPVWMMLKVIPLLFPLRGLLHGRRRTAQWASFLALPYLMGGIVAIYGFLAAPYFSTAADFWAGLLQGVLALAMTAGCMYYAYRLVHPVPE